MEEDSPPLSRVWSKNHELMLAISAFQSMPPWQPGSEGEEKAQSLIREFLMKYSGGTSENMVNMLRSMLTREEKTKLNVKVDTSSMPFQSEVKNEIVAEERPEYEEYENDPIIRKSLAATNGQSQVSTQESVLSNSLSEEFWDTLSQEFGGKDPNVELDVEEARKRKKLPPKESSIAHVFPENKLSSKSKPKNKIKIEASALQKVKKETQSDIVDITSDDEDDITEVQKTPQKRKGSTLTISNNDNDDIIISKPLNKTPRKGSPPRETTVIFKSTSKTSTPKKRNALRKIFDDVELNRTQMSNKRNSRTSLESKLINEDPIVNSKNEDSNDETPLINSNSKKKLPKKCTCCEKPFPQNYQRIRHEVNVHFKCHICENVGFETRKAIYYHLRDKHKAHVDCPYCEHISFPWERMKKHIVNKHSSKKIDAIAKRFTEAQQLIIQN